MKTTINTHLGKFMESYVTMQNYDKAHYWKILSTQLIFQNPSETKNVLSILVTESSHRRIIMFVTAVEITLLYIWCFRSPFIARQRPLHRSASLSAIPDHPHINYLSFSIDETLGEVFSEADLKYLTDIQLQELQQISSQRKNNSRHRAVTFSVLQEGSGVLSRKGSVEKDHLCDSSSVTAVDYIHGIICPWQLKSILESIA